MARRPPPRRVYRSSRVPRWVWPAAVIVVGIVALLVIRHMKKPAETTVPQSNRPFLLQRAQTQLRADPNIADLIYSAPLDQWDATPANADTAAAAFAHYLCFTLAQAGVTQPQTSVRVIDGAKLEANGFDYAAASRGTIRCGEETR
ncbi:MAG: hypothetical protein ACTHM8_04530 [Sphingomonas sp.]